MNPDRLGRTLTPTDPVDEEEEGAEKDAVDGCQPLVKYVLLLDVLGNMCRPREVAEQLLQGLRIRQLMYPIQYNAIQYNMTQ